MKIMRIGKLFNKSLPQLLTEKYLTPMAELIHCNQYLTLLSVAIFKFKIREGYVLFS